MTRRIILAAALILTLGGCGNELPDLTGQWTQTSGQNPGAVLSLNADGTAKVDVMGGVNYTLESWTVVSERVMSFQLYNKSFEAGYSLIGDRLDISRVEALNEMNGTYEKTN